jgi:hypothetical protein
MENQPYNLVMGNSTGVGDAPLCKVCGETISEKAQFVKS